MGPEEEFRAVVARISFNFVHYYFGRRKHVEDYVRETPSWVIDVQRATTAT